MDLFILVIVFTLGACLGSFANVVIYRLPQNLSVVSPRSRCRSCSKAIAWYDNIPIFSWLILRGKCRNCKASYSFRYPFVEFLMATLFALTVDRYGMSWLTLEYLIFVFGLVTVTFIDFDHMILPDIFTLSGIVIGLVGSLLNPQRIFIEAVAGVVFGGGTLWALAYLYQVLRKEDGMGGGDIKLLAWIGAVLGWKAIPFVIIASSVVGSVVGISIMIIQRKGLKTVIPFGPYLALGSVLYFLGGDQLGLWYLRLFFPDVN